MSPDLLLAPYAIAAFAVHPDLQAPFTAPLAP
jgi:hypothetical protein